MANVSTASKPTILVVEDHPMPRATAVEMFHGLGFRVLDAYNARDALALLREHPEISVLFSDVRMPGMDGIELAEAALALRPDLKVVLTSGYMERAPLPGVPFVAKPWRLAEIAATVGSA